MEKPSSSVKKNDAFDQVAPSSASAYAPSSSTQSKLLYDVFINHRGPDVKHTLAKDIYDKLSSMGVEVFLDNKVLEPGDSIPTELQEAMDNACLHVAIFSEKYAKSSWCLAELSYMVRTGVKIIPVFYGVGPSDLRWVDGGKGIYADSFAEHESKGRYTPEKLREWKKALQTVSYIMGYDLNKDDWGSVLEVLANHVMMAMGKAQVAGPTSALGLEERIGEIEEILQGVERVHIIGIVGMGGCGKTTLAKELFSRKSSFFSRCSFLYDVRDTASKNQLPGWQKRLLEELRVKFPQFESIEKGKEHLARNLRSLRALIVLDNVDHTEQIDSLLLEKDRLGSGSLVIITTRDVEVLTSWGISDRSIYRMKGLSSCHAKKLFCLHAFQKSDATDGFEDLVERAIQSCQGLPLSLKVFGGQLCSKPRDYWESQIKEISRVLPKGILSSLKISYDALDSEEQDLFLDVACFFIGEEKSLVLQLWDGLVRSGVYSWQTLQNKCLVELDEENRIRMHDHLRDLGREIANGKLPYRIWFEDQINIIQAQAKERMQVPGIMAATSSCVKALLSVCIPAELIIPNLYIHEKIQVRGIMEATSTFSNMYSADCSSHYPPPFEEFVEVMGRSNPKDYFSLKYLVCNNMLATAKIGELSRGLVWLRCNDFNHANLSSCLSLESLRVLQLYDVEGLETIWENTANPPLQLKELILETGLNFERFPPSIGRLKHLKKIVITGSSMTSLPNEFCNLISLEHLDLSSFRELSSLPISFGNLRNLRHLDLTDCSSISTLPISFKQLTNLRHLYLVDCRGLTFNSENSSILQNITKLEYVNISYCKLEFLPRHIANQSSMTKLEFLGSQVTNLPANIGQLKKLEDLWMESLFLTSLPDNFGDLSSLRKLKIDRCQNLKSLPISVGRLNALEELVILRSGVESLPEAFGQLVNLLKLRIEECPIRELAFGSGSKASLNKLRWITLEGTHLSTISISENCCPSLETLELCSNNCLTGIETLPKTVNRLKLISARELDALPSFAHLTALKELEFKVSRKVEKVEGLEYLRSLKILKAHSEWEVPGIQSLEQMERLKTVELSANSFAALEPCIRTIKKWPSKLQIWARVKAMDDVESIVESVVNDFRFGQLGIIDSCMEESDEWTLTPPHMQSSDAAIVCFVIQCLEEESNLLICGRTGGLTSEELYDSTGEQITDIVWLGRLTSTSTERWWEYERWVWVSVCDFSTIANEYHIAKMYSEYRQERNRHVMARGKSEVIIKRGTLVVGEKECVIEGFKKLLVLLKG